MCGQMLIHADSSGWLRFSPPRQKAKFGSVKEISAVDYTEEVNKAGEEGVGGPSSLPDRVSKHPFPSDRFDL